MCFDERFEIRVRDVVWKGILEGRSSGSEGPVSQCSDFSSGDGGQDVGVSRSEMVGGGMALEKSSGMCQRQVRKRTQD